MWKIWNYLTMFTRKHLASFRAGDQCISPTCGKVGTDPGINIVYAFHEKPLKVYKIIAVFSHQRENSGIGKKCVMDNRNQLMFKMLILRQQVTQHPWWISSCLPARRLRVIPRGRFSIPGNVPCRSVIRFSRILATDAEALIGEVGTPFYA